MTIPEIRDKVRSNVNERRFEHTLGVASTASLLGSVYGVDRDQCEIAGLLHDCAKCYSDADLMTLCEKAGILLTDELKASPQLLHAVYGPTEAALQYGITDHEILRAIRYHTTGKEEMSRLEQILFVSDFIEPHRSFAYDLTALRKLSLTDLDLVTAIILKDTIEYLKEKKVLIDNDTLKAFDHYKKYL